MALLDVVGLEGGYGDVSVLTDVTVEVPDQGSVAILGANAAGKTTLMRALSGSIVATGAVTFDGEPIDRLPPHERIDRGLIQIPEGRQVFPFLTVAENLDLGGYPRRARSARRQNREMCLDMFPILATRHGQLAGSLSGGEQQMLAIGRGLMSRPRLLMLDEPSLGLAPKLVTQVMDAVTQIHASGVAILIVEQNVQHALRVADRAYVLESGRVVLDGAPSELRNDDRVRKAYLGL